jgi:hypothetical protein
LRSLQFINQDSGNVKVFSYIYFRKTILINLVKLFCGLFHNDRFKEVKWLFLCLFFHLVTAYTGNLVAQSFPFREYSVVDGLPQSQATKIVQDSRGFIWIITRNGLSRFDGLEFVNYFRKDGLPSNAINDVIEDTSGTIMALSKSGISWYTGNRFVTYPVPQVFKGLHPAVQISRDSKNNFYILSTGPDKGKGRIILFNDGIYTDYGNKYPALDTMHIIYLKVDKASDALIIGEKDNFLWEWKNETLKSLRSAKLDMIFDDLDGFRCISNDTIYKYNNGKLEVYNFKSSSRKSALLYNQSQLTREILLYYNKDNYKISLPFNFTGYFIDNEDVVWLTSEGNLFRLLSTAFNTFSETDIGAPNIWAISEDRNGHIWFGSLYNSLIEWDGREFRERTEWKRLYNRPIGFFKGSRVMANGDTWFSTDNGVLIWNGTTFSILKGLPPDTQICYIYEDPDDKSVMLGTQMGLFVIRNGNLTLLQDFNDNNLGVIEGITKDDSGIYWFSGHKGVLKFDGKTPVSVEENVLSQAFTYTIIKDFFGGLWVTSEEGLFFKGKDSPMFVSGLPDAFNKSANSIISIDSTHILVGRPADICIIDLKKFYSNSHSDYFRIYDRNDGFEGKDCLDNGLIKDRNGRFWILTSSNVILFDPGKVKINNTPPVIRLTGFSYQTDSLTWEPVDKSNFFYKIPDELRLNMHQNKVQMKFAALSFTNPENVKLQYRLLGFDDQWSLPLNKRFVIYEKLPPGHYIFQVKGTNADGIETAEPFAMEFRIIPAFWQTNLFLMCFVILIIALSVIITLNIMRRRLSKQKEEERLRSELSRLQMSSVLKQFDPHFSFNVISSVGSLIMKGEKELAYDYIIKLSALLRTLLSDGSIIFRSLSDEIDFVRRYCELQKLRFKDRFDFKITIDENVDLHREIPKMIIQTFVENAIKHGFENRIGGGKVVIEISKTEDATEIAITDNGIGRDAALKNSRNGTGQGLKIINGIFGLMNEYNSCKSTVEITDIEVNKVTSGTRVQVIIPDNYRFEFGNSEN